MNDDQPGARTYWYTTVAAAAAIGAFALLNQTPYVGLFHDDGIYLATARSLAEGTGYRLIDLPGAPIQSKYPIVYPWLLSLVWRVAPVFPQNIAWLKAVGALSLSSTIVLAAGLFRRWSVHTTWYAAIAFAAILGLNPVMLSSADLTLSDVLFTAACLAALWIHVDTPVAPSVGRTVLGAALCVVAYCTRQVGIAFIGAGLMWAWWHGRRRLAFYAVTLAVLMLANKLAVPSGSGPSGNPLLDYYTGYESALFARLLSHPRALVDVLTGNVAYMAATADTFFLFGVIPGALWVYLALVALGVRATLRRAGVFLAASLVLYVAIVLAYPFSPTRYMLPLIPIVCICLFNGAVLAATTLQRALRLPEVARLAAALPLLVLLSSTIAWASWYRSSPADKLRLWLGVRASYGWSGFDESFRWVKAQTQPSDVIATAYDPAYFLYTGRRAIRPWIHQPDTYFYPRSAPKPDLGDPAVIKAALDSVGATYLAVEPLDGYAEKGAAGPLFRALLAEYGARATLVFASTDGLHRIYRLAPGG